MHAGSLHHDVIRHGILLRSHLDLCLGLVGLVLLRCLRRTLLRLLAWLLLLVRLRTRALVLSLVLQLRVSSRTIRPLWLLGVLLRRLTGLLRLLLLVRWLLRPLGMSLVLSLGLSLRLGLGLGLGLLCMSVCLSLSGLELLILGQHLCLLLLNILYLMRIHLWLIGIPPLLRHLVVRHGVLLLLKRNLLSDHCLLHPSC
jgi:hypothetical protein